MAEAILSPRRHADRVLARTSGSALALDEGRDPILTSWRRCVADYGLDPSKPGETRILSSGELVDHREPMEGLLRCARPVLEDLHADLEQHGYCVLFTNRDGVTIDHLSSPSLDVELRRSGLYLGSVWREETEGTNGVGTCITTRRALTVHRDDHFRVKNIGLTCTVAPIFDPEGDFAAVLDVSSMSADGPHVTGLAQFLVDRASHRIANAWFQERHRDRRLLRLFPRPDHLDPSREAMIALDHDGRVVAANALAQRLLPQRPAFGMVGLADLFEPQSVDLLCRPGSDGAVLTLLLRGTGQPVFALAMPATARHPARTTGDAHGEPAVRPARSGSPGLDEIAGAEPSLMQAVARLRRMRRADLPLLVLGEVGTGRDAFARAYHREGARGNGPYLRIDCSAAEGAGVCDPRLPGRVRDGTLHLDHVGSLGAPAQAALLRLLAEREAEAGGAGFDLVCTAEPDWDEVVRSRRIRPDLATRIASLRVVLPPLRLRVDRTALMRQVVRRQADALGVGEPRLGAAALARLEAHPWPGNLRELDACLRAAVASADGGVIGLEDLPIVEDLSEHCPSLGGGGARVEQETERMLALLIEQRWCISKVSRILGVDRSTIHRRMNRFGITPPNRRV
jgi:transcriptional regulator of acetoin/glycerol metabolism